MVFDAPCTGNSLRRHPQGMAFLLGPGDSPEMNDAIAHSDIFVEWMRPALHLKFGKKPLANDTVVKTRTLSDIGRRQSLQQVAACHQTDEPAALDDQHAFDTMLL